ncbi:MatE family protein [Tritrichomonas foetus]|uniref:MatE family protein n=1 Tax=Tritrichomonas foetus TaxID=1144522 RepID=A0A1J4J7J7_9EUKA|nr:MatE family protein [Tritrichomonas foetus]|eukprot:OHS95112.1 MatE family protein [Tritrichomonas foetus]
MDNINQTHISDDEYRESSIVDVPDLIVPDDEEKRLGRKSPLRTIILLSIGPLISQIVNALYGLVDSLWVAKTIGSKGVAVFGAVYVVEFISVSVSQYLCNSLSARASFLFGQQQGELCSQLYVDFIRVAFGFAILVPAIVLPITKPLVRWFGADEELTHMCFNYMIPKTCGAIINFVYMIGCGLIQAQGRSILYGAIQTCSFILNMAVFDPLLLLGLKLPIWSASFATVCSEFFPAFILLFLAFKGKIGIFPKFNMFGKKFSQQTFSALRVGFSSFVQSISLTLPVLLMQKYFNEAAKAIDIYDVAIQLWAVIEKLYQITGGICIAFSQGLLPTASYAYGAGRLNRMSKLVIHAYWLATSISTIFSLFMIALPSQIASIWSTEPDFIYWSKRLVPITFYSSVCFSSNYIAPTVLQAMKRVMASTLLSFLTLLLPIPVFSTILYFTKKDDPGRILYTYTMNDVYSFIVSLIFLIKPMKILCNSDQSASGEFVSSESSNDVNIEEYEEDNDGETNMEFDNNTSTMDVSVSRLD